MVVCSIDRRIHRPPPLSLQATTSIHTDHHHYPYRPPPLSLQTTTSIATDHHFYPYRPPPLSLQTTTSIPKDLHLYPLRPALYKRISKQWLYDYDTWTLFGLVNKFGHHIPLTSGHLLHPPKIHLLSLYCSFSPLLHIHSCTFVMPLFLLCFIFSGQCNSTVCGKS